MQGAEEFFNKPSPFQKVAQEKAQEAVKVAAAYKARTKNATDGEASGGGTTAEETVAVSVGRTCQNSANTTCTCCVYYFSGKIEPWAWCRLLSAYCCMSPSSLQMYGDGRYKSGYWCVLPPPF